MLGLKRFSRKPSANQDTFCQRVQTFWDWFEQNAGRFYETIDAGQCTTLTDEVVDFMEDTLPRLSWVFGPGQDGGHSFTVTGEGMVSRQLLARRWYRDAIEAPGWTFHWSRQPADQASRQRMAIGIGPDESIDMANFRVSTRSDQEREKFDIVAWHPMLEKLPESDHATILFLLLDEALGEFGVEQWLGEIKVERFDEEEAQAGGAKVMPMTELPPFVESAFRYHQWQKLSPLESYSGYRAAEPSDGPRGDTIAGTTLIPNLVIDYVQADGQLDENELAGSGAELAYLRFASENLPAGQEVDTRANIEDALDEALEPTGAGRTLGGAIGTRQSYIDLVLFDGQQSRDLIEQAVNRLHLRGEVAVETF